MKNLIIVALFFVAILTPSFLAGQTNKFETGIEGGAGVRYFTGGLISDNDYKPALGYTGGLTFRYNFAKKMTLRSDICMERKGSTCVLVMTDNVGIDICELECELNADYVTIPVLFQLNFGNNGIFFINSGLYAAYLLNYNLVIPPFQTKPESTYNNTDLYNRFDMGFSGGIGTNIGIDDKLNLSLEARVNFGMIDLEDFPDSYELTRFVNSANIIVGVTYPIGKMERE